MKIGQEVVHKNYGKAKIIAMLKDYKDVMVPLLEFFDQDSLVRFNHDRDNMYQRGHNLVLKYCYEPNLNLISV
jgi:hypothetical protein